MSRRLVIPRLPDGGGRRLVLATSVAHDQRQARASSAQFPVQLRDTDPQGGGAAAVESPPLLIDVDLGPYEFEDGREGEDGDRPGAAVTSTPG